MLILALFGGLVIGCCLGALLMGAICKLSMEDLALKKAAEVIRQQILLGNIVFKPTVASKATKKELVN